MDVGIVVGKTAHWETSLHKNKCFLSCIICRELRLLRL